MTVNPFHNLNYLIHLKSQMSQNVRMRNKRKSQFKTRKLSKNPANSWGGEETIKTTCFHVASVGLNEDWTLMKS